MEISEFISTINDVFRVGRSRELMFQYADDIPVNGREVSIGGQELVSFGSCSYLGLETDPRLKEGVIRAVERYGTQFSTSRGYVSVAPYADLEERMCELFGGYALVTPTTTLGHIATIPVLVNENDAIILDHQVHASVQMGATHARAAGARVEVIRHGDLARLEELVEELSKTRRHVWHMVDGVYSMFGDLPNAPFLQSLLDRYEQFHLYVDDAHGMSIDGKHGRGVHLGRMPHHPRMIVTTSMAKAFAAGGAVFVFPTDEMRQLVRMCGAPLTFGGPMQPPMLGAVQACTTIHLSPEIETLKAELRQNIDTFNELLVDRDLPLLARNHSPIFFLRTGPLRLAWNIGEKLKRDHGLYVNIAAYPTVPMRRSGIRMTTTRHHTRADLERMADALAAVWPQALEEEGLTQDVVDQNFVDHFESATHRRLAKVFELQAAKPAAQRRPAAQSRQPVTGLELQYTNSIDAIDPKEWDALLGHRGPMSASHLAMLERTFRDRPEPESNWKFHYWVVRHHGKPVLATFFTEALSKDDMLMREEFSRAVEARRKDDPYLLTSRTLMMGSLMSEGDHLYLDRTGPWREALEWVLEEAGNILLREKLSALVVRDLPGDDAEMDDLMLNLGLVKAPMLPSYEVDVSAFDDDAGFLALLGKKTRKSIREEVLAREPMWTIRLLGQGHETPTDEELAHLHQLYMNVKARRVRLNTFDLPDNVLPEMAKAPNWEIVSMHLAPEHGGPEDGKAVIFVTGHVSNGTYAAFMCGIDYRFHEAGPYRQMLWQAIRRAKAHGCTRLALGVDADFEKQRLKANQKQQCVYLQATEDFGGAVLRQIVEDAALTRAS